LKYLIDTHTLLWIIAGDPKLSPSARDIYLDKQNEIWISIASVWEMAIKISLGKLTIPGTLSSFMKEHILGNDIRIMNISLTQVCRLETMPFYHWDPFDRLLIAQAIEDNIPVISADIIFDKYDIQRVW
jgi:PIN domain nuclease of toxin-antitoxin system